MAYGLTKSLHLVGGSSHYAHANGNGTALNITSDITVEGLFKFNAFNPVGAGEDVLLAKSPSGGINTGGYKLALTDPDALRQIAFSVGQGSGVNATCTGNTTLLLGVWYHIAGTWTHGSGNRPHVFINGMDDGASSSSTGASSIASITDDLYIGCYGALVTRFPSVDVSLVRVWSADKTSSIPTNMFTVFGGAQSGMAVEYSLDNVYTDASGNGLTLTAVNSPTFTSVVPNMATLAGAALITAISGNVADGGGGTGSLTINIPNLANRVAVLYVAKSIAGGAAVTTLGATIDSVSMTQQDIKTSGDTGGNHAAATFVLKDPAQGAKTLAFSSDNHNGDFYYILYIYANAAQGTQPNVHAVSAASTSNAVSATASATKASVIVGFQDTRFTTSTSDLSGDITRAGMSQNGGIYRSGDSGEAALGTGTRTVTVNQTGGVNQYAFLVAIDTVLNTTYNQAVNAVGAGAGVVKKGITMSITTLHGIGAGVAAMTKRMTMSITTLHGIGAGLAVVKKGITMSITTLAAVGVGIADMSVSRAYLQALAAVGVGQADIIRQKIYGQIVAAVGAGVATLSKTLSLHRTLSAVGAGVAEVLTVRGVIMHAVGVGVATITMTLGKTLAAVASARARIQQDFFRTKYTEQGDDYDVKYPHGE